PAWLHHQVGLQRDPAKLSVPDQDFSRVIHVVDKKSGKVDGAWELSDNLKELRLRHLEPKRDLIVTIGKEVKALNNATFSKDYEKTITTRDIQPSVGFFIDDMNNA
ncbi:hypothetical protein ACUOFC_51010, partial [Escherichia sp. TWPC-MK]